MTALIKICGITTPELARFCANQGAQFIGIVCCPKSKRYVDLKTARLIAQTANENNIIPVAVFTDLDASSILSFCRDTGVSHVQLHGENSKNALGDLPADILKICANPRNLNDLNYLRPDQDYILFDGEQAGSGQVIDWNLIKPPKEFRFFLAGGLTVDNVRHAISATHPFGVDVSSGVESSPGVKSEQLIKQFIEKVQHG